MKTLTMRERMLAVVQARHHDRVPFAQYSKMAGFVPDDELWQFVGRDNIGLLHWTSVHRLESPNCRSGRDLNTPLMEKSEYEPPRYLLFDSLCR